MSPVHTVQTKEVLQNKYTTNTSIIRIYETSGTTQKTNYSTKWEFICCDSVIICKMLALIKQISKHCCWLGNFAVQLNDLLILICFNKVLQIKLDDRLKVRQSKHTHTHIYADTPFPQYVRESDVM